MLSEESASAHAILPGLICETLEIEKSDSPAKRRSEVHSDDDAWSLLG